MLCTEKKKLAVWQINSLELLAVLKELVIGIYHLLIGFAALFRRFDFSRSHSPVLLILQQPCHGVETAWRCLFLLVFEDLCDGQVRS